MTDYACAGDVATRSSVDGLIDVSYRGSNSPPIAAGNTVAYADPSAPTTGTVTSGVADGLPNSPSLGLTPFLRTSFISDRWANDVDSGIELVVPTGSGILQGDLMVAIMVAAGALPAPTWLSTGWTLQSSVQDSLGISTTSVWTRIATATEDARRWAASGGSGSESVQVRAYGNATFGAAALTQNAIGGSGQSSTAPLSDAHVNGLVIYAWTGSFGTSLPFTAILPTYLTAVKMDLVNANQGIISAELAVVASVQPALTATITNAGTPITGAHSQVVISLAPLQVFRYAQISLEEAVGDPQNVVELDTFLHIIATDQHSGQTAYGFTDAAMVDTGTGTVYSFERWVRVRFNPDFNTVRAFRFWAPNLTTIPAGWTVKYGTTSTYAAPVNSASSVATSSVPTSDPGQTSPNAGGSTRLAGTGPQYSDWIVLQASVDTTTVGVGPVLGFSIEGTLIPVEFSFSWIET